MLIIGFGIRFFSYINLSIACENPISQFLKVILFIST